jgi:predicted PurR-regulated permease PerM
VASAIDRSCQDGPAPFRDADTVSIRRQRAAGCHHRLVSDDASALRVDAAEAAGARLRLRFDWWSFVWLVVAVLGALALIALFSNTTTMLTRIGIGILVALALDPLVDKLQRRLHIGRGIAVGIVAAGIIALAALLVLVLGPRAVDEARQFSEQLPDTVDQLEDLPVVGGWLRDNEVGDRVQNWVRELPDQFTDERVAELASTLVSGVASVAMVTVLAIAVLVDGENLLERFRRLLPRSRQAQADAVGDIAYRTLGRYFGGSITVAVLMGVFVLALGLLLGIPLAPLAAVWAMLTDLIPQVGGFLGGSFLVLLAVTQGVTPALIAGVAFVAYMNIENHLIQPAIVGRSVDLTPPTTMVAAFVGGAIAGVPGALVATPFAGAVKAIYLEARGRAKPDDPSGGGIVGRLKKLFHKDD